MKEKLCFENIVLTTGKNGMYVNTVNSNIFNNDDVEVLDVTGAGDVVITILLYSNIILNEPLYKSAIIANYIAVKSIKKIVNYLITKEDINEYCEKCDERVIYENEYEKIKNISKKYENSKIVFTNGCFDIIHSGHLKLLKFSKSQGDILIVGLNTDNSITKIKGQCRPINNIYERVDILKQLDFIDHIIIFGEIDTTPLKVITLLKPNTIVKGGDYKEEEIVGYNIVDNIVIFDYIKNKSSSSIINKILNDNNNNILKLENNTTTINNDFLNYYYQNKTIVITGGTGFIGRNIVNILLKYRVKHIIIFDRTIKYTWNNTSKITYIKGNLLYDIDILKNKEFDILFHEAANVDTTDMNEKLMIETNYTSFIKLVHLCINKNAKMIYASSAAVYGNSAIPNTSGINEFPLNIYGKTKLMMDEYILKNKTFIPIPIIGIRYFNVYGNGETHKKNMMSMIRQMINKINNDEHINLFEFGEQKRDFVYVKDVALCNLLAGLTDETYIYNCGSGISTSFNDIFEIIKRNYPNKKSKINYIKNTFDFFQNETLAQLDETSKKLNYKCFYDINNGITDYITGLY